MRKKSNRNFSILYIMGYGRSGSTVLETIISKLDSMVASGELEYFLERGIDKNECCTCGKEIIHCPFWANISLEYLSTIKIAGLENKSVRNIKRKQERLLTAWKRLIFGGGDVGQDYCMTESALIRNIISDDQILLDSSKSPGRALALMLCGFDVKVIHLFRDSRAVAYSWQRKRVYSEFGKKKNSMPIYPSFLTSIYWIVYNITASFVIARYFRNKSIRWEYDSIADTPERFISDLEKLIGRNAGDLLPMLQGEKEFSTMKHSVAGNPVRFAKKQTFQADREWVFSMNKFTKFIVTLITGSLLILYRWRREK